MSYQDIQDALILGLVLSCILLFWKLISLRRFRPSDSQPPFGARLSWFAIPYPLFIALAYIALPWIRFVFAWHQQ